MAVSSYLLNVACCVTIEHCIQIVVVPCGGRLIALMMMLLLCYTLVACQDFALRDVGLACAHDLSAHENLTLSVRRVALCATLVLLLSFENGLFIALLLLELLLGFESTGSGLV